MTAAIRHALGDSCGAYMLARVRRPIRANSSAPHSISKLMAGAWLYIAACLTDPLDAHLLRPPLTPDGLLVRAEA
ncbi:MAG: hypothetical protein H0W76_00660 [Pyrinomonadaceae bacterium]|nr:hypothetical protein [Pyrinomonadaceae bacterium]